MADAPESSAPEGARPPDAFDIVAIGSPLVDILCRVDEALLERLGLTKGAMALADLEQAEAIHRELPPGVEVSGGSAANTAAGVAALGGRAAFIGKIADDGLGDVFRHDIDRCGVTFFPSVTAGGKSAAGEPGSAGQAETIGTGRCLVMVTGDAERTMATHLGAATLFSPPDLPEDEVAAAEVVYLEGYLWDLPPAQEAMRRAMAVAHAGPGAVALSMSDPFCVERHRREFLELLLGEVDVVFANEDEVVRLFAAESFDRAVSAAEETGLLLALTRGPRGSVVVGPEGTVEVPAAPVETVVDTTGAGDLFAAGFLYGLTHGADPETCARLGGLCAAEIISHLGARPEVDLRALASSATLL